MTKPPSPRDLFFLFLKLGLTAFGGPAAHIALMEHEVVRRRAWLSRGEFLDLVGAANLIPGPNSTELALHIGYRKAGWRGLVLAGACFILPAALIVTVLAWLYVRYGSIPEVGALFYGVKPVMIAIVLQALWSLSRTAVKNVSLGLLAAVGILLSFLGVHELLILVAAGFVSGIASSPSRGQTRTLQISLAMLAQASPGSAATVAPFGLGSLFLFFLKVGSVLFGSGYVLLAFLRADLVQRWHWLTEAQLLDAIAVGQITPGPVFTTATFIGYLLGGAPGAVAATMGIFLPAFVFVAVSGPFIPRLRRSATIGAILDGVNVASLALMAVVTWQLARSALVDMPTLVLAILSVAALFRLRVNSAWLVLAGAIAGLALSLTR
jgi:chromate transporter